MWNNSLLRSLAVFAMVAGFNPEVCPADDTVAPDNIVQVGSGEKDACSKANPVVSIPGKFGRVEVRPGETKWVQLETLKSTFYWRCGDTEEKFEYKDVQPFNVIKVERSADTGRISWTCYVKTK